MKTDTGTSMAAPGVNGKLLVAISDHGNTDPANLIKQPQGHAVHVVQCNHLPCEYPDNPPVPCSDLIGTT